MAALSAQFGLFLSKLNPQGLFFVRMLCFFARPVLHWSSYFSVSAFIDALRTHQPGAVQAHTQQKSH